MNKDIVQYKDPTTGETVLAKVLIRFENGDVRTDRDGMRTRSEVRSIYATTKDIEHKLGPGGKTITIPKGTQVYPANNLPDGGYWVIIEDIFDDYDQSTNEQIESFARNYGLWVSDDEVDITLPF